MKKSLLFLFVMMLAAMLVFAACGDSAAPTGEESTEEGAGGEEQTGEEQASGESTNMLMATGGTTGTYYAYGGVIGSTITNAGVGLSVTANSSGASAENVANLADKQVQLAILQNDVLDYAYNATDMYEGQDPVTSINVIATLYPEVCQLVVAADSGITSVADLRGKAVSIGDIGSGVEFNAKQILAAYGLTTDDIDVRNLSFADSATAMQDRAIDAFFATSGVPNTSVVELSTAREVTVLPVDGAEAEALMEQYAFYTPYEITPEEYSFLSEPVTTVAICAVLVCTDDLSEDVVYNLTKTLFDKKAEITTGNAKGEYLDPAYAVEGNSVPYHPGAIRYYEEVGVM